MNSPTFLAFATIALLAGCATPAPAAVVPREPAPPAHCPLWHETPLREVPVAYGLLEHSDENARAVRDLRFWPGGCVFGGVNSVLVCPECRYAFYSDRRVWERETESREGFCQPLSAFIADFPISGGNPTFWQEVEEGGVFVRTERLLYDTRQPRDRVRADIAAYLARQCVVGVEDQARDDGTETHYTLHSSFSVDVLAAAEGAKRVVVRYDLPR